MERADMERGLPKICQGISFSKHRMLETLQERGTWTHTSHTSDPLKTHTSGTLIQDAL